MNNNKKLSTLTRITLGKAYMNLYNAIAEKYQATGHTVGDSWYLALREIGTFLMNFSKHHNGPAIKYVVDFYDSHRQPQAKASMKHTARDTFTKTSGDIDAINTKIDACKQKLESNIRQHDSSDTVVTMNPISQENAISRDFFYWVSNLPDG